MTNYDGFQLNTHLQIRLFLDENKNSLSLYFLCIKMKKNWTEKKGKV